MKFKQLTVDRSNNQKIIANADGLQAKDVNLC
jgi:hypothetical protein